MPRQHPPLTNVEALQRIRYILTPPPPLLPAPRDPPLKSTILFARGGVIVDHEAERIGYRGFFPMLMQIRLNEGSRPYDIEQVRVREPRPGETPDYWAWWDYALQEFDMVFALRMQTEVCFPYGSRVEEERGRGRLLNVVVERVEPSHVIPA